MFMPRAICRYTAHGRQASTIGGLGNRHRSKICIGTFQKPSGFVLGCLCLAFLARLFHALQGKMSKGLFVGDLTLEFLFLFGDAGINAVGRHRSRVVP